MGLIDFFVRCWKGQESLAKAYWLLAVLFGLLLVTLIIIIFSFFLPVSEILSSENPFYQRLITAIMLPFTIFSTVCVWRCGRNSTFIWRLLSRILVILAIIDGAFALIQVLAWNSHLMH